jgi:uncharacterized protein YbbC (DUF1343 family)
MVRTGLQRMLEGECPTKLKKSKIGLIANHTCVDQELRNGAEQLISKQYQIQAIFAPEHGFRGNIAAGAHIIHQQDSRTRLPVYSLYGNSKKPTAEMLQGLNALLFDMQDIGVRFYTYIYTMANAMKAAAEHGLDFYVADRPNPITGDKVEGNIIHSDFRSFVGDYNLPIRHGMTIGELARYFNQEYKIGCSLQIIDMEGWKRNSWYDQTSLQWVMPSPNATGMDMAILYPGTCLFEGTNLSEGRGTTRPFETIGAPWIDGEAWLVELQKYSCGGVIFRPLYFVPTTSKYIGEECQGIQIHVIDREKVDPIRIAFAMIESVKTVHPLFFDWVAPYKDRFFIDLLLGTDQFRHRLNQGDSLIDWLEGEEKALSTFREVRKPYLLYP